MEGLRSFLPFSKEAMGIFLQALDITWKGMLGVFLVMTLLWIAIIILGRAYPKEKESAE